MKKVLIVDNQITECQELRDMLPATEFKVLPVGEGGIWKSEYITLLSCIHVVLNEKQYLPKDRTEAAQG